MSNTERVARYRARLRGDLPPYYHPTKYEVKETERLAKKAYSISPRGRYAVAKGHAKARGIAWNLSFEEWFCLWQDKWDERGRGGLMMCRIEEPGSYSVDNVYIGDAASNAADYQRNRD